MATKHNDHRAGHTVHVFDHGTNVKFQHNEYTISLAADGAVVSAVNWINKQRP